MTDLVAHARAILDGNLYLTLGTVDAAGRPWTSPVYFAPDGDRGFLWASEAGARHSRQLAERPDVSLVVFDSTVAPYHGRAVYAVGRAREVSGDDLDRALTIYPRPSTVGVSAVTREDVSGGSTYRLYRATVAELWVLCPREPGEPCELHGLGGDHRALVPVAGSSV